MYGDVNMSNNEYKNLKIIKDIKPFFEKKRLLEGEGEKLKRRQAANSDELDEMVERWTEKAFSLLGEVLGPYQNLLNVDLGQDFQEGLMSIPSVHKGNQIHFEDYFAVASPRAAYKRVLKDYSDYFLNEKKYGERKHSAWPVDKKDGVYKFIEKGFVNRPILNGALSGEIEKNVQDYFSETEKVFYKLRDRFLDGTRLKGFHDGMLHIWEGFWRDEIPSVFKVADNFKQILITAYYRTRNHLEILLLNEKGTEWWEWADVTLTTFLKGGSFLVQPPLKEYPKYFGLSPLEVYFNERNQLHRVNGAAIVWRDGTKHYFLNGVLVSEDIGKPGPDELDPKILLTLDNTTITREVIKKIGYENILRGLDAKLIDSWNGYELFGVLGVNDAGVRDFDEEEDDDDDLLFEPSSDEEAGEVDVGDDPDFDFEDSALSALRRLNQEMQDTFSASDNICLLKMTCPSTGQTYILRVPPEMTKAREALRWVNRGKKPEQFSVET